MGRAFQKLSRPAIRRLAPGGKITEHGIAFERLANGDGAFSVNVMVDGQRIHRVIGRESEGVTRTQCEEFIEKVRSEAREGRLSLPSSRKTHLTFAEAAKKYLDRLQETDGKNLVAKRRQLRLYVIPFFGTQRLDIISTFTVDRYKRRRLDTGASNGTVNLELATLSHFVNCAIEWRWLKSRPCKIQFLEKTQGRIVALSDEQADALFRAAVADDDPYCWLFVAFGLNTAMRHREILRARFDQLDLDNHRLLVPRAKGGQREQPFTPQLAEILRREMEIRTDRVGWILRPLAPRLAWPGTGTGWASRFETPWFGRASTPTL
jgi:integrase